jgi:ElaB/YqjD/DUF883 family membrane-anchored ribosome-binding protein
MKASAVDELREAGHQIREAGSHTLEAAKKSVEQVKDRASEYYSSGRDRVISAEGRMEDAVRQAPLKSVLLAAGIGAALALLWRRG